MGTFAGHIGHKPLRSLWWKGYRPGVRSLGESPKVPSGSWRKAYARATVAITRARSLCLIMGPLDMKGLLGAATVVGTLMYKVARTFRTIQGIPICKSTTPQWRLWIIWPEWTHAVCSITMRDIPQFICNCLDCLGSSSVVFPRPPQIHNDEVKRPNLVVMRDIVLQCLHNGRRRKVRACQTAILPEHVDESFIWRYTGEVAIMKIKVDLALLASKGWTFICSIGHLHRRHASSESRVLSPIGYGTFL